MKTLESFVKKQDYLLCVDSDGCAMDTMDVKHIECFGPCMIELYGLREHREEVQKVWNEVNLYRLTRGINRFPALVLVLKTLEERNICKIEKPYDALASWTENTNELSARSLEAEIEKGGEGAEQLKVALSWSLAVNRAIAALPETHGAYPGVEEALSAVSHSADIAVVSSANGGALEAEWTRTGLVEHIDALLGQEYGSKAHCIEKLAERGYDKNKIIMVGDAPGDLRAAEKNGVLFYPILVGKEEFSWKRLQDEAFPKFLDGSFEGEYQRALIDEFYANLS